MTTDKTLANVRKELEDSMKNGIAINAEVNDNTWFYRGEKWGEKKGKLEGLNLGAELKEKEILQKWLEWLEDIEKADSYGIYKKEIMWKISELRKKLGGQG